MVEGEEEAGGFVEVVEVLFDLRALFIDLEIEAGDLHGPDAFEGEVGVGEIADEGGLGRAGGLIFRGEVGDEGVELGLVLVVLNEPFGGAESVGDGIPGGGGLALGGDGAVRFHSVFASSLFLFFGYHGKGKVGGGRGNQAARKCEVVEKKGNLFLFCESLRERIKEFHQTLKGRARHDDEPCKDACELNLTR